MDSKIKSEKSPFVLSPGWIFWIYGPAVFLTFCSNSKRLKKSEAVSLREHTSGVV
jgi:hypothetical protein